MNFFIIIFLFILGAFLGSFYNVCIFRMPLKISIMYPSSRCMKCKSPINFYDNIPIISYIILKGKCRKCKSKISIIYPIVEILTAILFVVVFIKFKYSINTIKYLIFVSILIIIAFIDLRTYTILDRFVYLLIILGFLFGTLNFETYFLGASVYCFFFFLLYIVGESFFKKEAIGFGDLKLAAGIGAFLGYNGLFTLYLFVLFSFGLGALVSLFLISKKVITRKHYIPFGPFMVIAAILLVILF